MDKLAFGGGTGSDEKTTEQRIQDEIAGDDVLVSLSLNSDLFSFDSRSKAALLPGNPLSWRKW